MDILGGILTKGLASDSPSTLVYGPLHLNITQAPSVQMPSHGGHSSAVTDGKVKSFKQQRQITVTFFFNQKYFEKTFIVGYKTSQMIVKVSEIVDTMKTRVKIIVDKIWN